MNNNNLSIITNQQTITSMEIADITGKNHSDVLRAIRKMEPAWEAEHKSKFAFKQRLIATGCGAHKKSPYYELSRKETLFVATKFNDQARARLVIRWAELEEERMNQQVQQPVPQHETPHPASDKMPADPRNMSRLQILQLALAAEEESERLRAEKQELEDEKAVMQDDIRSLESDNYGLMLENGQKDEKIKALEQRTAYLGVILADNGTVTVSQIAQDYGMGAPSFNNLLKGLRIQRKIGEQWILYSDIINHGYVQNRMIPIHHAGCPDTFKPLTVWTQSGRKFLYDRLKKHGILPLCERQQTTS